MTIIYTDHAEENIRERKLIKQNIVDVVKNPDKFIEDGFGRKIAQKVIGSKLLRVVYEKGENNVYIIITAYYTEPERYG